MSTVVKAFLWQYGRALIWIALVSAALYRGTRSAKVARAFVWAHLGALGFGILTDVLMLNFAPKSWLEIDVLQWVFTAPIAIFTVISLWIGNREKEIVVPDVFMALAPVVAWGLLVVYGWQSMYDCHVLGAWFVSAACGGVDLYARVGPDWARRRSWSTRAAGYAAVIALVYLVLPRTG